jgi:hypothetical protein
MRKAEEKFVELKKLVGISIVVDSGPYVILPRGSGTSINKQKK